MHSASPDSLGNDPTHGSPAATARPPAGRGPGRWLLALAFALNLAFSAVGWDNSPREIHDSRQVQTALSIKHLAREGLQLDYPLPLFGPPWSAPFEFPLYQGSAALLARTTGLPAESAGRATALLFLYLALPAAWLVQEALAVRPERRWIFPALLLLSPAYLYYSRSFMIESAAVCAGLWFLFAFGRALTRPGFLWPALALALGALVALAKFTTAVVFLVPAALLTVRCLLRPAAARGRLATAGWALALAGFALAAGFAWTRHADAVKASNPLASAFVSSALSSFVFGPASQRLEPAFWGRILVHAHVAVLPAANAVLLAVFGLLLAPRHRGPVFALLASFLAGPLVFANLHYVHDYYFYACGVFALAALALACSHVLDLDGYSRPARAGVVALVFGIQLAGYAAHYFPAQRMPASREPELAGLFRTVTRPDDILLVLGQDWNPALAYFSDRRAIMVVDRFVPELDKVVAVLERAGPHRVTALVVSGHFRLHPHLYRELVARLNLTREPVLMGVDTHVYVAPTLMEAVREHVRARPLESFPPIEEAPSEVQMKRQRVEVAGLADPAIVSMMTPAPIEILHPFTVAAHGVGGRLVADAHAPTDFVFAVPAGATRVELEFGILPGAYTSDQPTDGVDFRIELVSPGGSRRTLFTRDLRPTNDPRDRGPQRAVVELAAGASGRLLCRTLPGPAGSIASDWAYWARIEIK